MADDDYSPWVADQYHWLRRALTDLPREMDGQRRQIAAERRRLRDNQRRLVRTWQAWCKLQVEHPNDIERMLAHHARVMAALRASRTHQEALE